MSRAAPAARAPRRGRGSPSTKHAERGRGSRRAARARPSRRAVLGDHGVGAQRTSVAGRGRRRPAAGPVDRVGSPNAATASMRTPSRPSGRVNAPRRRARRRRRCGRARKLAGARRGRGRGRPRYQWPRCSEAAQGSTRARLAAVGERHRARARRTASNNVTSAGVERAATRCGARRSGPPSPAELPEAAAALVAVEPHRGRRRGAARRARRARARVGQVVVARGGSGSRSRRVASADLSVAIGTPISRSVSLSRSNWRRKRVGPRGSRAPALAELLER